MGKKKKGYKEYIKLKNSQGKSGELKNEDVDFRYYAEEKRRKELNRNIKKIENKRKLLEKSCLEIHRMDILKMKSVYVPLLANSDGWADEFWSYALKNTDCFRKTIYPQKIKEIYLQWGK